MERTDAINNSNKTLTENPPSPFLSFLGLVSPVREGGAPNTLAQRIFAIHSYLFISLIEIITGIIDKRHLRLMLASLYKSVAKVYELNKSGSNNIGAIKTLRHVFKKRFFIFLGITVTIKVADQLLRMIKNVIFSGYDFEKSEPSNIEKQYAYATSAEPDHSDSKFEQERSQGDTLPKISKNFYILTQKIPLIGIDLYLYWTMLPTALFLTVLGALTLAAIATYVLAKPETETNSIRKQLSRLHNEAAGSLNDKKLVINAILALPINLLDNTHREELNAFQTELNAFQTELNAAINQERLDEITSSLQEIIVAIRRRSFLVEKAYNILSTLANKLIQEGFNCFMILICALRVIHGDIVGDKVVDIAWMTSTITVTKDAYKNLLDNIKQIRTYEEFKKNMERVTQSFPSHERYFKTLASNLSDTYFPSPMFRVFSWGSTGLFLYTLMLSEITLLSTLATSVTPYILSPWSAIPAAAIAWQCRQHLTESTTKISSLDGKVLAVLLLSIISISNISFVYYFLQTYSVASFLPTSLPSLSMLLAAVGASWGFDQHIFQRLAFVIDVVLIFTTQTLVLAVHNVCYAPDKLARGVHNAWLWWNAKISDAPNHETSVENKWITALIFASLALSITGKILLPATPISLLLSTKQLLTTLTAGSYLCCLGSQTPSKESRSPIVTFLGVSLVSILAVIGLQYGAALAAVLHTPITLAIFRNLVITSCVLQQLHQHFYHRALYLVHQVLKTADTTLQVPLDAVKAIPAKIAGVHFSKHAEGWSITQLPIPQLF